MPIIYSELKGEHLLSHSCFMTLDGQVHISCATQCLYTYYNMQRHVRLATLNSAYVWPMCNALSAWGKNMPHMHCPKIKS